MLLVVYEYSGKVGKMEKIVLIYDAGALAGDEASRDVIDQMDAIEAALESLGMSTRRIGVDLDLGGFKKRLFGEGPDVVFNLVESLDGSDRLQTVVTMCLEDWGIRFTGCGSGAMMVSNHKIESKRRMVAAGLPTAECVWVDGAGRVCGLGGEGGRGDWIVKAVESHASVYMDDASVLRGVGVGEVVRRLREEGRRRGEGFFAERYIEGREFNLSVLGGAGGERVVLPSAEIYFEGLGVGRPRIVGYAAKWEEESEEYGGTRRRFGVEGEEVVVELRELAGRVWEEFGFAGYGRVDFRVDEVGRPFILEANANPCLAPDAGFAAAAREAGMDFTTLIARIVDLDFLRECS